MRPDRIIIGEVRGGEALDLLQAMTSGHGGSMTTNHANTASDALRRLETMALMSSTELPLFAIRSQVASAIDVVILTLRFNDGTRRVTGISEVLGLDEQTNYKLAPIFRFRNEGETPEGAIKGRHIWSKIVPTFAEDVVGRGLTRYVKLTAPIFNLENVGKEEPPTRAIA
jgi:pilus assembly protein CpaF